MAITFKSVGNFSTTNSGSLVVAAASGIAVNDLIIIHACTASGASFTTPTGWTFVNSKDQAIGSGVIGNRAYVFYKKAVSGDIGTSVTLTPVTSNYAVGRMICFNGQDTSAAALDLTATNSGDANGANTTLTTGSAAANRGFNMWMGFFSHDGSSATMANYSLSGSYTAVTEAYDDNYNYAATNYLGISMGYAERQAVSAANMSSDNTGAIAAWTGILAHFKQPITSQTINPSALALTVTQPAPSLSTTNVLTMSALTMSSGLFAPTTTTREETIYTNDSKNSTTWTNQSKSA